MRRPMLWRTLAGFVVALVLLPATALAAKPEIFHERFSFAAEDVEVCGVNVDIVESGVVTGKAFFDNEGNFVRFMATVSGTTTYTNDSGESLVLRFSNQFSDVAPVIDEDAGTITFETSFTGLPEMLKRKHGRMLTRDAGRITFIATLDLDTFEEVSFDVVVRGPHPDADSDFALFCEVFEDELG